MSLFIYLLRIRQAIKESAKVVDIDGSYLSRKYQRLQEAGHQVPPIGIPPVPPMGWRKVTENNYESLNLPKLSSGTVKFHALG